MWFHCFVLLSVDLLFCLLGFWRFSSFHGIWLLLLGNEKILTIKGKTFDNFNICNGEGLLGFFWAQYACYSRYVVREFWLDSLVGSSSTSHIEQATGNDAYKLWTRSSSEVPASPQNTAAGGKASLQPKRTPVTDREIEAVMVSNDTSYDRENFDLKPILNFKICDRTGKVRR